jgi:formamidopyrimidine-DNA glycosylase
MSALRFRCVGALCTRYLQCMPELPEVEWAARALRDAINGRTLRSIEWLHPSLARTAPITTTAVVGQRVVAVERVAKWQEIRFANGAALIVHFRMTGDWAFTSKLVAPRYARAHFGFSGSRHVWLVDSRVLARVSMRAPGEAAADNVGPDALDVTLSAAVLRSRMAGRRVSIKQVLLDQSVIAGVGNIYAAEALWFARVDPRTPAAQLSEQRVGRVLDGIRWTMGLALADPGRQQYGESTERFVVYDREGAPCTRCGSMIRRVVQGQRSTYWCTRCQR